MLNFEDAAYNDSEQGIQTAEQESAARLALALYESLQGVNWGKPRVDLAKVMANRQAGSIDVKILDLPIDVVTHLNSVLEVCLFGVEGDALAAQIKESFELFTKEERMDRLRKSQSELFGGMA